MHIREDDWQWSTVTQNRNARCITDTDNDRLTDRTERKDKKKGTLTSRMNDSAQRRVANRSRWNLPTDYNIQQRERLFARSHPSTKKHIPTADKDDQSWKDTATTIDEPIILISFPYADWLQTSNCRAASLRQIRSHWATTSTRWRKRITRWPYAFLFFRRTR